jgi:hypothetical protein
MVYEIYAVDYNRYCCYCHTYRLDYRDRRDLSLRLPYNSSYIFYLLRGFMMLVALISVPTASSKKLGRKPSYICIHLSIQVRSQLTIVNRVFYSVYCVILVYSNLGTGLNGFFFVCAVRNRLFICLLQRLLDGPRLVYIVNIYWAMSVVTFLVPIIGTFTECCPLRLY